MIIYVVTIDKPQMHRVWTREEIKVLYHKPLLDLVFRASNVHRYHFKSNEIQKCTLVSIKTGGCSENCGYCAQSQHHRTSVKPTSMLTREQVRIAAMKAKAEGSTRFCMGAAWRGAGNKRAFQSVLDMVRDVKEIGLEACVTLGMINDAHAKQLKDAGLTAYNHNLDTSREFYPNVVSTRTYDDRLETLRCVRDAGITVCSGGIIGLGESHDDRISLIHTLASQEKAPESVPINVLVPIEGTPIGDKTPARVEWDQVVRMIATSRIVMPNAMVRLSAGRKEYSSSEQAFMFFSGANSIFSGDKLLTVNNSSIDEDEKMFQMLGLVTSKTK
jgi:biotin synthase